MDFAAFVANEQAVCASLHALLIVSEAARKLGNEAHGLVPGQPWGQIRSIGNRLRLEYDGVDPDVVWRITATGDLAAVQDAVGAAVKRSRANQTP